MSPADLPRDILATAVRFALEELAARVPGHSVEVRVPPFGAIQMIPGQRHTRGTPPAVVQTDPLTFLALVTGHENWSNGIERGFIKASGQGADLSTYLPLDKLLDERG
ncbi:MAG: sterol carrier family protein [Micrococcales bacterium]|nr:sterol carrier family protein [Micrococcales bacterium]